MNKKFFTKILPAVLLAGILLLLLFTVFTHAGDYGHTPDEELQDNYGRSLLSWYTSLGHNTSFMNYPAIVHMPEHGAFFDTIIAVAQRRHMFGDQWHARLVVNGLGGVLGIVAIALCGYELGGWWCALLAAFGLGLYPRYYGAMFNNPKDIPFAAAMALVLWSVLFLIKRWHLRYRLLLSSVLVGFCIGMASSIRVTGVIWFLVLALLAGGIWIFSGRRVLHEKKVLSLFLKQASVGATIGITSLATMMLLWPYIFLNPLVNLYRSIKIMQKYDWNGDVLFNGTIYHAENLPRSYVPTWLVIGSPPQVILLALLGLSIPLILLLRKRILDPKIAVVSLAFLVPIASLVILRSTLYDTMRQFLFLVPTLILLAAYGAVELLRFLVAQKQYLVTGGLAGLMLLSYGFTVNDMLALHPFEYIYLSPIADERAGASVKYDGDYWGECTNSAAVWLANHYKAYTDKTAPSVIGLPSYPSYNFQYMIALPDTFQVNATNPDFSILATRGHLDRSFPAYRIIHTESRQGVSLCVVKVHVTRVTTTQGNKVVTKP